MNISPSNLVWGQDGQPLPETKFTITVNVTNVEQLWSWQVRLYFDPSIIDLKAGTADVGYPSDSSFVFAGGLNDKFTRIPPMIGTEGGRKYVMMTACLYGGYHFTGSGKLFVMNFTAINPGSSTIEFSRPFGELGDTYLAQETDDPWSPIWYIPFDVTDGNVVVKGYVSTKEPSSITIGATPSDTYVKRRITIEGKITPERPNVRVTVNYKPSIWPDYNNLTTTTTNDQSIYTCVWIPDESDIFYLEASWEGDQNYTGASSITQVIVRMPNSNMVIDGPRSVGNKTLDLPTPPFNMTIVVTNVTNLFGWQIRLHYVAKYVEAVNITFPSFHVFADKNFTVSETVINQTGGYVFCKVSLEPGEVAFNGTGALVRIFFRGIYADNVGVSPRSGKFLFGECPLTFNIDKTVLWDSVGDEVGYLPQEDFMVRVDAKIKVVSSMRIYLDPSTIVFGDATRIQGSLGLSDNTERSNATVWILYRIEGGEWNNLTTVQTNPQSGFLLEWKPENVAVYSIKAKYFGDNLTTSTESSEATLTVATIGTQTQSEMDLFPVAIVVVIVYIVAMSIVVLKRTKEE
jgi:hypothetical protein